MSVNVRTCVCVCDIATHLSRTFLVMSELPEIHHNRRSEYDEIDSQLGGMEETIETVNERSRRRNEELVRYDDIIIIISHTQRDKYAHP